jgi:hypothetical protein
MSYNLTMNENKYRNWKCNQMKNDLNIHAVVCTKHEGNNWIFLRFDLKEFWIIRWIFYCQQKGQVRLRGRAC